MRLTALVTCCALAFSAPYALGSDGLIEDRFWTEVQASGTDFRFRAFVRQFPDSRFVAEAERQIAALRAEPRLTRAHYVQ